MRERFEAALRQVFEEGVPHVAALGITVEAFDGASVVMRLPFRDDLVGDPEAGVLATGAVTTLIDTACGLGVIAALERPRAVATIDLRIDYLRPASSGRDLLVHAECYRITRYVAFSRATAYHEVGTEGETSPVASALGTFMLSRDPSAAPDLAQEGGS